jgi:glycosyltransferase involved in cell wall biosynthesis
MRPLISIIIPVYNDPEGLCDTLSCLKQQDMAPELYEIIVIDNGSSDNTLSVAERIARKSTLHIQVVQETQRGSYAARNKGILASMGELLCFIDADMSMDSDYLSKIADHFNSNTTDYLGCHVELVCQRNTLSSIYEEVFAFPVCDYIEKLHFAPTCCLTVRSSTIELVGLFDSRLESGGDFQFGRRVHAAGLQQKYIDEVVLRHPARWQFSSLIRKAERTARGHAQLSFYFPQEYGHHFRGQISLLNFLPLSNEKLRSKLLSRNLDATLYVKVMLLFFPIPLRFFGAVAALRERARLKQQGMNLDP